MPATAAPHVILDDFEDVGLVDPAGAERAHPLGDISQDDPLAFDGHLHLDRPRLVDPRAGTAAIADPPTGHSPRLLSGHTSHAQVDTTIRMDGKGRPGPGGKRGPEERR